MSCGKTYSRAGGGENDGHEKDVERKLEERCKGSVVVWTKSRMRPREEKERVLQRVSCDMGASVHRETVVLVSDPAHSIAWNTVGPKFWC